MLPDEVMKAVERLDNCLHPWGVETEYAWQDVRAHLLAREADVERLNAAWDSSFKQAMLNGQSAQEQRARAERAEALLREALPYCDTFPDLLRDGGDELRQRITAHLSENSRG